MDLLNKILNDKGNRKVLIDEFQQLIWKDQLFVSDIDIEDMLIDLAFNLDFYDSNSTRIQVYGDEKLENLLKDALIVIDERRKELGENNLIITIK